MVIIIILGVYMFLIMGLWIKSNTLFIFIMRMCPEHGLQSWRSRVMTQEKPSPAQDSNQDCTTTCFHHARECHCDSVGHGFGTIAGPLLVSLSGCEGVQGMPPQNMPVLYKDYFEIETLGRRRHRTSSLCPSDPEKVPLSPAYTASSPGRG